MAASLDVLYVSLQKRVLNPTVRLSWQAKFPRGVGAHFLIGAPPQALPLGDGLLSHAHRRAQATTCVDELEKQSPTGVIGDADQVDKHARVEEKERQVKSRSRIARALRHHTVNHVPCHNEVHDLVAVRIGLIERGLREARDRSL